jgi:predicted enzyme related to lactoylglutathione lyase
MKFTGTCLITNDVTRLADFYSKLLGVAAEGDSTHMELHTEGAGLTLFSVEGMEGMAPGSMQGAGHGSAVIAFEVDDIHAEYARLQSLGTPLVKPLLTHPWGAASFWFRDPDGNIVDFFAIVKA